MTGRAGSTAVSRRVLVVDDEPDWCGRFRDIFLSIGFAADTAAGRAAAEEALRARAYDLLVLDIYLTDAQPALDYQLLLCRLSRAYPDMPIVAATGKPLAPNEAFELRDLGVAGFVYKPQIQVTQVRDLVYRLVGAGPDPAPVSAGPVDERLARIERVMAEGLRALDERSRAVLRLLGADVTDCPRLFTLEAASGGRVRQALRTRYRLTLWCEMPGAEHAWEPATYTVDETREWLRRIAPYALRVAAVLRVVVPVAASVPGVVLSEPDLKRVQHQLDLVKAVAAQLPDDLPAATGVDGLRAEEGAGLRTLRALLLAHDEHRRFGDLRKVVTESGDVLWVCPEHTRGPR